MLRAVAMSAWFVRAVKAPAEMVPRLLTVESDNPIKSSFVPYQRYTFVAYAVDSGLYARSNRTICAALDSIVAVIDITKSVKKTVLLMVPYPVEVAPAVLVTV